MIIIFTILFKHLLMLRALILQNKKRRRFCETLLDDDTILCNPSSLIIDQSLGIQQQQQKKWHSISDTNARRKWQNQEQKAQRQMQSKRCFREAVVVVGLFPVCMYTATTVSSNIIRNKTDRSLYIKYMYTVQHSVSFQEYIQYIKHTLNISSILLYNKALCLHLDILLYNFTVGHVYKFANICLEYYNLYELLQYKSSSIHTLYTQTIHARKTT